MVRAKVKEHLFTSLEHRYCKS